MNIDEALKIGINMERYTPISMPIPNIEVTTNEVHEALHTLAKNWPPNKEPCTNCEIEKKNYPWPPFCKWCGMDLSKLTQSS